LCGVNPIKKSTPQGTTYAVTKDNVLTPEGGQIVRWDHLKAEGGNQRSALGVQKKNRHRGVKCAIHPPLGKKKPEPPAERIIIAAPKGIDEFWGTRTHHFGEGETPAQGDAPIIRAANRRIQLIEGCLKARCHRGKLKKRRAWGPVSFLQSKAEQKRTTGAR